MSTKSNWGLVLPGPELLTAVLLLGILSAAFLPKILHKRHQADVSKIREVVATLEESYAQSRSVLGIREYTDLYDNVAVHLNVLTMAESGVDDPGSPLYQVTDGKGNPHPCTVRSFSGKQGWVLLHNGVLLSGLSSQSELGDGTDRPKYWTTEADMYVICVDANGAKGPNREGDDVFWGNFQHNDEGASFRWGREQKWLWGAPGEYLVLEDGYSKLNNPFGSDVADVLKKR